VPEPYEGGALLAASEHQLRASKAPAGARAPEPLSPAVIAALNRAPVRLDIWRDWREGQ